MVHGHPGGVIVPGSPEEEGEGEEGEEEGVRFIVQSSSLGSRHTR